jgi:putative Holliday junction resolvase
VAVGQRELGIANALTTIPSIPTRLRWAAIQRLTAEWQPAGFVVGLSKNMDGSAHEVTHATLKFCRQLEGRFMLSVASMDETLSSREAW